MLLLRTVNQLANIHLCLGELETALPLFEEDVRSSRRLLGATHLTEPCLCSVFFSFCLLSSLVFPKPALLSSKLKLTLPGARRE